MKENYQTFSIGELCLSLNGLWKGKKEPFVNVGVIRNANFTKDFKLNYSNIEFIDVEQRLFEKRNLQNGDLIIEKSGGSEKNPVGRAVLYEGESGKYSYSNFTSILRIKDKKQLLSKYLYNFILYRYKEGDMAGMQSHSTGIHNLDYDKYLAIQIPVPSLSEQERIVKQLDEAFAKIDALKENAEKGLQAVKDLWQATLKEELRPKEGWNRKTLGEISSKMADGPFGSNLKVEHQTDREEVRIIQLSNIGDEGWKDTNVKYTSFEHLKTISRSEVRPNDIVIAKMMPAGRAILCPNKDPKYVLSSDAVKAEIKKDMDVKFVLYFINSQYFRVQVYENVTGIGRERTSLNKLKLCNISFPNINEQKNIVNKLEHVFKSLQKAKESYYQELAEYDVLKQSILRKAFSGEL